MGSLGLQLEQARRVGGWRHVIFGRQMAECEQRVVRVRVNVERVGRQWRGRRGFDGEVGGRYGQRKVADRRGGRRDGGDIVGGHGMLGAVGHKTGSVHPQK